MIDDEEAASIFIFVFLDIFDLSRNFYLGDLSF